MDDIKARQRTLAIQALNIGLEFGFIIALPLVAFVLLGKYFDRQYHHHYFVIIGIFLALASSITFIYRRINNIRQQLNHL